MHPVGATMLSFGAVTCSVFLLGLVFLPHEARRLWPQRHVSVTHVVVPQGASKSAVLYWSIPENGQPGWRHHLAIDGVETNLFPELGQSPLQPLSITRVGSSSQLLIGNWDGSLYQLDSATPGERLIYLGRQASGGVMDVVSSADGRFAVSSNASFVYGWDLQQKRKLWRHGDLQASCLEASCSSDTAFVGDYDGTLHKLDLRTGLTLEVLASFAWPVVCMAASPDGRHLALVTEDRSLQLLDLSTRKIHWVRSPGWPSHCARLLDYSPQGDVLVTTDAQNPRGLALYSAADGRQLQRIVGHEGLVLGASFAADGTLWSWGADATVRLWDPATGKNLQTTTHRPGSSSTG